MLAALRAHGLFDGRNAWTPVGAATRAVLARVAVRRAARADASPPEGRGHSQPTLDALPKRIDEPRKGEGRA